MELLTDPVGSSADFLLVQMIGSGEPQTMLPASGLSSANALKSTVVQLLSYIIIWSLD